MPELALSFLAQFHDTFFFFFRVAKFRFSARKPEGFGEQVKLVS